MPAQQYVSPSSKIPVTVNPIFRGKQQQPSVQNDLCSVLMPFHEPFLTVYEKNIKPVLENAGFRVKKANDIFSLNTYIIEDIWRLINQSKLLVADVTGKNPNVFYELGIAIRLVKELSSLHKMMMMYHLTLNSYSICITLHKMRKVYEN